MKDGGKGLAVTPDELLKAKRADILRIAAEHGARNVRIFGSVARGEAGPESDIDVLVDFEPGRSLLDHVALIQDLEDLLGRKVDVVAEDALHWYIRDRVIEESVPL
ncbi:MAG: nucleotidyltransferase family protein [Chloroflexi bacterium]|nr:nucleotidyltransferase family protein [Chloroflexota bacterium]